jgi:hypothetical protein
VIARLDTRATRCQRRAVRWLGVVISSAAACYTPAAPAGAPCPDNVCPTGQACVAGTCTTGAGSPDAATPPAAALAGLRWLVPCTGPDPTAGRCAAANATQSVTLAGVATDLLQVAIRIRGVVEVAPYTGGVAPAASGWYIGGAIGDTYHNIYRMTVSAPRAVYYVNFTAAPPDTVVSLDYNATLPINGGATVTFEADTQDRVELQNKDAQGASLVVPGVVTTPAPYNGQFLQVDVLP